MKRRGAVLLSVSVVVAANACGGGSGDEIDYYGEMRKIDGFQASSDAELDELAANICDLVEQSLAAGETGAQAADRVFAAAVDSGMSQADALIASTVVVGANCPLDISE
nr:hypothetical protein [uncultured Actinotalea sp.]